MDVISMFGTGLLLMMISFIFIMVCGFGFSLFRALVIGQREDTTVSRDVYRVKKG